MSQLRLAFSSGQRVRKKQNDSPTKLKTSSVVLAGSVFLSWKLERLHELRPDAVGVIERLVDNLLDELEGRRP